jgi:predicted PurR-regulated permease PerM
MQELLERYAPSELLLGLAVGLATLFTGLPFVVAVVAGLIAAPIGRWLDHYGVRRIS